MIEALKRIIYSQELSPLFLALLEQNIQGCRYSSIDRDGGKQLVHIVVSFKSHVSRSPDLHHISKVSYLYRTMKQ